uniref:Zinc finger C3HC-type containing 1 n=1 Tax=Ficedula albicollis TaxID=59894 RepID=U3JR12_FICAL
MLRCSSCQAHLCVSLQLAFDLSNYKERCEELRKALSTAHEKFCFWPDSPCPDRFARLLVDEPRVLLQDFLDRFQSLCQLELQLPSLRPEDLKNMSLTEERITRLLQLIEEELEHKGTEGEKTPGKISTEILQVQVPACILALCGWGLQVQVPACILALCGWTCSAASGSMNLSVITCSRCMRRVGLWGFQQLESAAAPELDSCSSSSTTPAAPERFPPVPTSPRRMLTRSQDPASEQPEKSPSPAVSRPRGWDSPSSMDKGELDVSSPALRSRPVTRSMAQGDATEVPSSPVRRAKRARLCSSSSSDTSSRSFFHPSSQHRDWCPWVSTGEGEESQEDSASQTEKEPGKAEPGWEVVLKRLLGIQKCDTVPETEPVSLSEKSCKVFRIFRQWESLDSS